MKSAGIFAILALFGVSVLGAVAYLSPSFFSLPHHGRYLSAAAAASLALSAGSTTDATAGDQKAPDTTASDREAEPFSTTTYQYKVLQFIDPCTINTLAKAGWRIIAYGTNSDTGSSLTAVSGKSESCQDTRLYAGLIWAVFEFSTSTTNNTVTLDSAAATQYKLVQNVDSCTLNKLGKQGWRAVQFGTNLLFAGGYDETCQRGGTFAQLDWVMFQQPIEVHY